MSYFANRTEALESALRSIDRRDVDAAKLLELAWDMKVKLPVDAINVAAPSITHGRISGSSWTVKRDNLPALRLAVDKLLGAKRAA